MAPARGKHDLPKLFQKIAGNGLAIPTRQDDEQEPFSPAWRMLVSGRRRHNVLPFSGHCNPSQILSTAALESLRA